MTAAECTQEYDRLDGMRSQLFELLSDQRRR